MHPGLHGIRIFRFPATVDTLNITDFGDFSSGHESTGGHYNPTNLAHGGMAILDV